MLIPTVDENSQADITAGCNAGDNDLGGETVVVERERLLEDLMRESLVQPFRPEEPGISKSSLKCLTRRGRLQDSRKGCWDLWSTTFKPTMEDGNKLTETEKGQLR